MGRKSLAGQRRSQILDAFEVCLLEFGLENSTLERIAERAGVKRQIIRHYFGNRDALVEALTDRILATYRESYLKALDAPDSRDRMARLLDFFIRPEPGLEPHTDRLMDALIVASQHDAHTRQRVFEVYQSVTTAISRELSESHPTLDEASCNSAAHALLCLIYGNSAMLSLGFPQQRAEDVRGWAVRGLQALARIAAARSEPAPD